MSSGIIPQNQWLEYKNLAISVAEQNGRDETNTSLFQLPFVRQALRMKKL
jgi:hypothetical protein